MSTPAITYQGLVFPCVILPFAAMHTQENSPGETFDDMGADCEEASPESVVLLRSPVQGTTLREASTPDKHQTENTRPKHQTNTRYGSG